MKSIALMALIVLSRLGGNLLFFIFLARILPLSDFGLFSICFSAAAISILIVDYGLSQSILRDIGADKKSAELHVTEGLSLKFGLTLVAVVLCVGWGFFLDSGQAVWLFAVLALYFIANSYAEFFGTALRATGRYSEETLVQVSYTVIMLGGVVLLGLYSHVAVFFAGVLLLAKISHLALIWHLAKKHLGFSARLGKGADLLSSFKRGFPYAADSGVTNLLMNVDVLIVSGVLGREAAALYQAGQKVVQGYSATAMVFSNVYLPKLSRALREKSPGYKKYALVVFLLMGGAGLLGGGVLLLFSEWIVKVVYGEKFAQLVELFPAFGVLISVRLFAAGIGVNLTALGRQGVRVYANIFSIGVVVAASSFLIERFGLAGMVYSQVFAVSILLLIYGFAYLRARLVTVRQ